MGYSPWGRKESDTTKQLHFHFTLPCIREGNGNPLQCSCLENPRDGRARWAAVSGVAQSWARLKRLSSSSKENDTKLMAENEEQVKCFLMRMKLESEKAGLKLNIQKTKIMAPGPITSWQIDGETIETVTDFIFLGSKSLQMVTAVMKLKDTCPLEEKL